jgi:hypothetical protein
MEILKFINNNKDEFTEEIEVKSNNIHPRIYEELQKLRYYLSQPQFHDFLNTEKFCIYENCNINNEEDNFIEINYLTSHVERYLTDHYDLDFEYEFFYDIPAISEIMESTFSTKVLYNNEREHISYNENGTIRDFDNDYYDLSMEESIYLLHEAVKILCEYPAFQLLECPYQNDN